MSNKLIVREVLYYQGADWDPNNTRLVVISLDGSLGPTEVFAACPPIMTTSAKVNGHFLLDLAARQMTCSGDMWEVTCIFGPMPDDDDVDE